MAATDSSYSENASSSSESPVSPATKSRQEARSQAKRRAVHNGRSRTSTPRALSSVGASSVAQHETPLKASQSSGLRFLSPLPSSSQVELRDLHPGPFTSSPAAAFLSPLPPRQRVVEEPVSSPTRERQQQRKDESAHPERQIPASTWRLWTENERLVARSLERARAQDLAIHLYNAFILERNAREDQARRKRIRRGSSNQRSSGEARQAGSPSKTSVSKGKGRDRSGTESGIETVVSDSSANLPIVNDYVTASISALDGSTAQTATTIQFDPPRIWTAWPLPPHEVPREALIPPTLLGGSTADQSYKQKPDTRPSAELEECLVAAMTRAARERWEAREWDASDMKDTDEEQVTAGVSNMSRKRNAKKRRRGWKTDSGIDTDSGTNTTRSSRLAAARQGRGKPGHMYDGRGLKHKKHSSANTDVDSESEEDKRDVEGEDETEDESEESDGVSRSLSATPSPFQTQSRSIPNTSEVTNTAAQPSFQLFSSNVFASSSPSPSARSDSTLSTTSNSIHDQRPVFLADDGLLHDMLLPSARHIISRLDRLLAALHRIQMNNYGRPHQAHRANIRFDPTESGDADEKDDSGNRRNARRNSSQHRRLKKLQKNAQTDIDTDFDNTARQDGEEQDRTGNKRNKIGRRGAHEILVMAELFFADGHGDQKEGTAAVARARERCIGLGLLQE